MKRLVFLLFICSVFASQAQSPITLNVNDLGMIGKSYDLRVDSVVNPGIQPGTGGANQNWNFWTLNQALDTMEIYLNDKNTAPLYTYFPNSNIVHKQIGNTVNYYYNKRSTEGLVNYGIVNDYLNSGDTIKLIFSSPDTLIKLPAAYGDSCISLIFGDSKSRCHFSMDTNVGGFVITVPIDTVRIKHLQYKNSKMDAWGSVTTPLNVYDALRQRNLTVTSDTVWGYANVPPPYTSYSGWYLLGIISDTSVYYNWWKKDLGIPALTMYMLNYSPTVVTRVEWVRDVYLSVNETESATMAVYPNPAKDHLYISSADLFEYISVLDITGREVLLTSVISNNAIDISSLNNGIYFYRVSGKNTEATGKFIIQK